MPAIPVAQIEASSKSALMNHGAADWISAEVARAVARAEAFGNRICGLYYLESYCQQLHSGRVNGSVQPVVARPRPGFVKVDAKFGFAQSAFRRGLPEAAAAARENGIAVLAIGHAHTCTSLGYFTEIIAAEGLIGIGFTNASPMVAPPGGQNRVIGTNPIACSVPGPDEHPRLHFDFSTSAVALGKITMAKAAGEKIPLGWAVDQHGAPTTDPAAALGGALVSAGGYKGWGFGLMAELLAAGLTGGAASLDVKPLKAAEGAPHDLGQFYILIDPTISDVFDDRFERLAVAIAAEDGARIPGAGRQAAEIVDVPDALWALTQKLAA